MRMRRQYRGVPDRSLNGWSIVRRAQFNEALACTSSDTRVVDGPSEQVDDLGVSPEVGEVLERQVDRSGHSASGTQVTKLVELSLTAGHATTIHPRADAPLHSG
jgi:hypothetical protein